MYLGKPMIKELNYSEEEIAEVNLAPEGTFGKGKKEYEQ